MQSGWLRLAADGVLLIHLAFVIFVVAGGLLVLRWRRIMWLHVPAVMWGAAIEFGGWICPLTPLENEIRQRGGGAGYQGDFVEQYLLPVLYPADLTRTLQMLLGSLVLVVNVAIYWHVLRRAPSKKMRSAT